MRLHQQGSERRGTGDLDTLRGIHLAEFRATPPRRRVTVQLWGL